jgi:signal transduction histidine kinase/ActR/RegA family two-component response regulator
MKKRRVPRAGVHARNGAHGPAAKSNGTLHAKLHELEKEARNLRTLQADLELERDEYRELYEFAPIAALTLDAAYGIQRLNHAAAILLGELPDRLQQRNFRSFVSQESRPVLSQHLARVAGQKSVLCARVRLEVEPGESFPVELWTRVLSLRNSFEIRIVELREQERLEERTRRLTESERAAREESAAKDKFIAVLSHELRTPLTPVLAVASFLRKKPLLPELSDAFKMIERNITAEARLIDDLLDVNRIVRNKMLIEPVLADVHGVALEALGNLRGDAEAKHQNVAIALSATRVVANVDVARLRQVFSNLLKNAIKFTPEAGNIRLSSWNGDGTIAVEVQDDGIGIEPRVMRNLFEPFGEERGPSSGGGLGLGLTICKGLVELQSGRIVAHSRGLGQGSRFVVEFPLSAAGAVAESPSSPESESEPISAIEPRLQRVLLIEDHPDTVEVLTALLMDRGFKVEAATSLEAARRIDLETVDVIVSDIGLPDGTGLELMKELRARARRPAIALTGFGMESDVRASEAAGFDLHLTKPVSIERLVEAIHRLTPASASAK